MTKDDNTDANPIPPSRRWIMLNEIISPLCTKTALLLNASLITGQTNLKCLPDRQLENQEGDPDQEKG
jgi:hypothetical protein